MPFTQVIKKHNEGGSGRLMGRTMHGPQATGSQGPELPTHDQPPVPSLPLTPNWDVP